jgi:post-segregation antitoxin (ccd killing protein)
MLVVDAPKTRRLNIMVSESLIEWASITAESRGVTVSALVREALERELERTRELAIAQAADCLAPLYESDDDLTAFSALDAEEFA